MPRRSALAALAAGLLSGAALPGNRIGIGVTLVAVALAVAAALARARRRGGGPDRWPRVWCTLALGLAATATLRDAAWIVVPCLVAAAALGSLAAAGGATAPALARGLGAVFARLPVGIVPVGRAVARELPDGSSHAAPVARGMALGLALTLVFGLLFASGDAAFAQIAGDALPEIDDLGSLPGRAVWFAIAAALAGALATLPRTRSRPHSPTPRLGPAEWGIALVALDLLFAAFVAVQAKVLFGHDDHVLNTAGLTYAEYAREGFGQLLAAALLTLAVVAGSLRWARGGSDAQRFALRALLAVLCGLTFVVLASALHRLGLYEDAFGATRWRLTAEAIDLWIAALLALTVAALATRRRDWMPRACVAATAAGLLTFALSDPDRRIATRNVDRYEQTGRIDTTYLSRLSADALPALQQLPPPQRDEALERQRTYLPASEGWGGWNKSRAQARKALGKTGD